LAAKGRIGLKDGWEAVAGWRRVREKVPSPLPLCRRTP
jgi:hypothetical protein